MNETYVAEPPFWEVNDNLAHKAFALLREKVSAVRLTDEASGLRCTMLEFVGRGLAPAVPPLIPPKVVLGEAYLQKNPQAEAWG